MATQGWSAYVPDSPKKRTRRTVAQINIDREDRR